MNGSVGQIPQPPYPLHEPHHSFRNIVEPDDWTVSRGGPRGIRCPLSTPEKHRVSVEFAPLEYCLVTGGAVDLLRGLQSCRPAGERTKSSVGALKRRPTACRMRR